MNDLSVTASIATAAIAIIASMVAVLRWVRKWIREQALQVAAVGRQVSPNSHSTEPRTTRDLVEGISLQVAGISRRSQDAATTSEKALELSRQALEEIAAHRAEHVSRETDR